jgi:hypothetical protein
VLEAHTQHGGPNGGWGNDVFYGGAGFGAVFHENVLGAISTIYFEGVPNWGINCTSPDDPTTPTFEGDVQDHGGATGPGNTGDNFFPEGGNDIVNISADEVGHLTSFEQIYSSSGHVLVPHDSDYANWSTIWVGFYDVCNSAGPDAGGDTDSVCWIDNSGVGEIWNQAITDLVNDNGTIREIYVDGYGAVGQFTNDAAHTTDTPVITINGFHFGGPVEGGGGDTIVFSPVDWAYTVNPDGVNPNGDIHYFQGLVQTDGNTQIGSTADCPLGFATYGAVTAAGGVVDSTGPNDPDHWDVVLYEVGGPQLNAQALESFLAGAGHFDLNDSGVDPHSVAHILLAYNQVDNAGNYQVRIADVTLTNTTGSSQEDTADLAPVVHDLIHINTGTTLVGVGNLSAHNIDFVA